MTGPEQVTVNKLEATVNELKQAVGDAHEEVQGVHSELSSLRETVMPAVAFYERVTEFLEDMRGFGRGLGRFIKYGTAVGASIVTIAGGLRILGIL